MIVVVDGRYRVQGPVTFATVQQILEQAKLPFDGGAVRVDLSEITETDSSAIALLLHWVRLTLERQATIRFENPGENLKALAALYEVESLLPGIQS